ncbi:MAG: hypothetical protein AAFS06_20755 [Cyanobacteria bacterium J06631_12]
MPRPTPNWQPLSMLPTLAKMVAAQLEEVETQRQSLREAQKQPHVLDDHTVGRVLKVYGEQQEFMWVYEGQVERWQKENLSSTQRQLLEKMSAQLKEIKPGLSEILEIAEDLKGKTIESILGKSDVELALDVLSGKIPPPY